MQARRIIEARDHIAQAAFAAMRRVEAEAALSRLSRGEGARLDSAVVPDSAEPSWRSSVRPMPASRS
jgi:hypothetical protein